MTHGLSLALAIGMNLFRVDLTMPPKDTLKEKVVVLPTYFFKKNLSVKNAWLKTKYSFQKSVRTPVKFLEDTQRWVLTFEDDFDSINLKKWRLGQAWGEFHPEHPHQYYSQEMVCAEGGLLKLKGEYKPKAFNSGDSAITIPFAIGLINSDLSFQQKYGYFEIRSKNPKGAATWPAFWLTGAYKWPPEIDIFEMYGRNDGTHIHNQYATIHYGKSGTKSRGFLSKKINLPNDTDTSFHIYGCEWAPEYIRFYTDGHEVAYIRVGNRLRQWMDEPMVIVLNNAFDEKYIDNLNPVNEVKNEFVVDWIRVYKRVP